MLRGGEFSRVVEIATNLPQARCCWRKNNFSHFCLPNLTQMPLIGRTLRHNLSGKGIWKSSCTNYSPVIQGEHKKPWVWMLNAKQKTTEKPTAATIIMVTRYPAWVGKCCVSNTQERVSKSEIYSPKCLSIHSLVLNFLLFVISKVISVFLKK